jgi:hypothetical protein
MPTQQQMQARRGTAASWVSTNPTLSAGEIGFESDTNNFKIGNGTLSWSDLPYSSNYLENLLPMRSGQTYTGGPNLALGTSTANRLYFSFFRVPTKTTFNQIGFDVQFITGITSFNMGIYSNVNAKPDTLLHDFGATATTGTGIKTNTINVTLNPGNYWLAGKLSGGVSITAQAGPVYGSPLFPTLTSAANSAVAAGYYIDGTTSLPSSATSAVGIAVILGIYMRVA